MDKMDNSSVYFSPNQYRNQFKKWLKTDNAKNVLNDIIQKSITIKREYNITNLDRNKLVAVLRFFDSYMPIGTLGSDECYNMFIDYFNESTILNEINKN